VLVLAAFEGARLLYHVEAAVLWLLVALLLAWALWLLPFRCVPWEYHQDAQLRSHV
jgi:hypothetical protein